MVKRYEIREIPTKDKTWQAMRNILTQASYEKNLIDFLLEMSKVFLHNLITMSTIIVHIS